ncbi:hypothetical protein GCM10027347_26860 [Larkinella harenae]
MNHSFLVSAKTYLVIYQFRKQYRMLSCNSYQDGLEMITDLALHEAVRPIGIFSSASSQLFWHPFINQATERARHQASLLPVLLLPRQVAA